MADSYSKRSVQVEGVALLGCPFCGSKAVMDRMHTSAENFWRHRARCTSCWCATDWESETPEDCAHKWNRRAETWLTS